MDDGQSRSRACVSIIVFVPLNFPCGTGLVLAECCSSGASRIIAAMAYPPSLVANAVLYRAQKAGRSFDHMQVQKLVFFVHAWSLVLYEQSLLAERPEAWTYGPVFSSLYHRLKQFGSRTINQLLPEMQPGTGQFVPLIPNLNDQHLWGIVDQVLARYGHFSALQLSALTHEPGGPWERTKNAQRTLIDDDLIRQYFRQKLQNGSAT